MAIVTVTWWDGITVTVEIALSSATGVYGVWDTAMWDAGLWGPDETWIDVSEWVRSFETSRGFGSDGRTWTSGTASIVLDNLDGRFSPDNLDATAPYVVGGVSGVRPGRPVRIRMGYAGTTYAVWRGYAQSWEEAWTPAGPRGGDATMTVRCADEWTRLAAVKGYATTPAGTGETCGPRWTRILTAAGHTGVTDLDVGTITLQATDLSTDPVQELQLVADSVGGHIYVGADGTIHGRDRYMFVEDPRCTSVQVAFGDNTGVGQIPYTSIDTAPVDIAQTVNIAAAKRVGGTEQRYADASSRALYGDRSDRAGNMSRLICQTDAQVLDLATSTVAVNRTPEAQVKSLTIQPRRAPATVVPIALGTLIHDLVTVSRRPPSTWSHTMTRSCFITGVKHRLDAHGRWSTTFDMRSATAYQAFASSRWDTGLWGASDTDPAAALWFY